MMIRRLLIVVFILSIFFFSFSLMARDNHVYSIVPKLNVRELPSTQAPVVLKLRHNKWVTVLEKKDHWIKVKLPNGKSGFVSARLVTDTWIKVLKKERKLLLMKGNQISKSYPMALGFNPKDDKIKVKDGCTPEGRFYICQVIEKPKPKESYGPVSLRISYPNIEDARRGLKDKLINKTRYLAIVKAIHAGEMPPQNTILGSSIKIHGGDYGVSEDWTLGCMALRNKDMIELFANIPGMRTMVEIYHSENQADKYAEKGLVNKRVLSASQSLLSKGCSYTGKATRIIPLSYPMGDFDKTQGVCTDVVIRALRDLRIDLQALLYEDIILNPRRYRKIARPNPNIDHRRTRNLKIFLDHHAQVLTMTPPALKPTQWEPGDIVLMDTGIRNGTIYDHIGIVSSTKDSKGIPRVINLWTVGWKLNEMELLNGDYPTIVGHYRLHHPLYYDAYRSIYP